MYVLLSQTFDMNTYSLNKDTQNIERAVKRTTSEQIPVAKPEVAM